MNKPKAKTFDDCLASASEEQRAALEKLRKSIRAAAPDAEEGVSYGLAAFRLNGKPLAALAANAKHCAFYPMSGAIIAALKKELAGYDTSKGTIRFPAEKPLPAGLVKKLVKARIAEIATTASRGKTSSPEVAAILKGLDHPLKKEIAAVRAIILGVSPAIREGIKWNAPSFRIADAADYFATMNLRSRDRVQLVFHKGAKVKDNSTRQMKIPDPAGLIKWLASDRCLVTVGAGKDIAANRKALESIVRHWMKQP